MTHKHKVLEQKKYNAGKTSEWADQIGSEVIERMRGISPYFKYLVTCFIIQKVGKCVGTLIDAQFSCLTPLIDAYIDGCRAAL